MIYKQLFSHFPMHFADVICRSFPDLEPLQDSVECPGRAILLIGLIDGERILGQNPFP